MQHKNISNCKVDYDDYIDQLILYNNTHIITYTTEIISQVVKQITLTDLMY